jgi:hypothetical protein
MYFSVYNQCKCDIFICFHFFDEIVYNIDCKDNNIQILMSLEIFFSGKNTIISFYLYI